MKKLRVFLDYLLFASAILLAFLLVFQSYIAPPAFLMWAGRGHILLLHFPIVMVMVSIVQQWRQDAHARWYVGITALFSMLSAITGFLLSLEGGRAGGNVNVHQWLGVTLAYANAAWYWYFTNVKLDRKIPAIPQFALLLLVVATGHFGGMLTHGSSFLSWKPTSETVPVAKIPGDPQIFKHFVQPILDTRCKSCHNSNKAKGQLVLDGYQSLLAGGVSGAALDLQQPSQSLLLQRVSLPLQHEEHMPPSERPQLTDDEKGILKDWIASGANEGMLYSNMPSTLESHNLIAEQISRSNDLQWSNLPGISDAVIRRFQSNYITVSRVASGSDALQMTVFPHKAFGAGSLQQFKPIAEHLVELNLAGLTLNEKDFRGISTFSNLQKLNLNGTNTDDQLLQNLTGLPHLADLLICQTAVSDKILDHLVSFPSLGQVYAYRTDMTPKTVNGRVFVVTEAPQAIEFRSVLPPPALLNEHVFFREAFALKLQHPLNDINVHYQVQRKGQLPMSGIYRDSIWIEGDTKISYHAEKEGWQTSSSDSARFFLSLLVPDSLALAYPPNAKYIGRGINLLFDLDKGPINFGDSAWMAFRDKSMLLTAWWNQPIKLSSVVLSTLTHTDPYIFPPQSIVVRGGVSPDAMKVLGKVNPTRPTHGSGPYFNYFPFDFEQTAMRFIQIEVQPLASIPSWHAGKGQKGWLFVDELVLR
jgi:hypothetical protein